MVQRCTKILGYATPMSDAKRHLETLAIHAGQGPDPQTGAAIPPLYLSSTYVQPEPGKPGTYEYGRCGNPNRNALEQCLAAVEGGRHGLAFASGVAATSVVFQTLVPGDHVVACNDIYGGTYRLLDAVFAKQGIQTSFVDLTDPANLDAAITPRSKVCWVETPSNPLLKLVDLSALARICRERGLKLVVDNTFATPALQQPLGLGADAVIHSTTKYLNGHCDAIGGALITSDDEWASQLRFLQNALGAIPSPFDCYLILRGIKTLAVRMDRHCENALALATLLQSHPSVAFVRYPSLPSHPQADLSRAQMRQGGGVVSCVLKGGLAAAQALASRTQLFGCAVSLGGVESLIEVPALMSHASIPEPVRAQHGLPAGLVRLSVGLEHVADLQADLSQALAGIA